MPQRRIAAVAKIRRFWGLWHVAAVERAKLGEMLISARFYQVQVWTLIASGKFPEYIQPALVPAGPSKLQASIPLCVIERYLDVFPVV